MDRYTKFILTVIALGILTLNVQLFKDDISILTNANAEVGGMDWLELQYDLDFKKAVRKVVSGNCYVDGGYVYC